MSDFKNKLDKQSKDLMGSFSSLVSPLPVKFQTVRAWREYVRDNSTEFQKTEQDAVDDFRAVANRRSGQKPITDNEVIELLGNRFESHLPIEDDDKFEDLKDKSDQTE